MCNRISAHGRSCTVPADFILHCLFDKFFYSNETSISRVSQRKHKDVPLHVPPPGRFRALHAFTYAWNTDDTSFIQCAGIDAFAFIEYLRCALRVLVGFATWALLVNTAFYYTNTHANPDVPPAFLSRSSIVYLEALPTDGDGGSWDAWMALVCSLIGLWVNSLHTYVQLSRSWRRIVRACQTSMADAGDAASHAILVRANNPLAKPFKQIDAFLTWAGLYPGQVLSVRMCRDTGSLPKALAKFDATQRALAVLEAKHKKLLEKAAVSPIGVTRLQWACHFCACRSPAARAEKLQTKIDKQRHRLDTARSEIVRTAKVHCGPEHDVGLSYFVIFKSSRAASIAKQVVNLPEVEFEVEPAPVPLAVCWNALKPRAIRLQVPMSYAGFGIYIVMVLFCACAPGIDPACSARQQLFTFRHPALQ